MDPLISIVTSYYNDEDFLAESISSVLGQTYSNFEYILINHASEDGSRDIAHSFHDPRIRHIDLAINSGGTGNMLVQIGMETAKGKYIKFFSADDILLPHALERLLYTAEPNHADLVFGNIAFVDVHKKSLGRSYFKDVFPANQTESFYLQHFLLGHNVFPYPGHLIKTDMLQKVVKQLDCGIVAFADMTLWLRLLLSGARLAFFTEPVVLYRIHANQMSSLSQQENTQRRMGFEAAKVVSCFFENLPSLSLCKKMFPHDAGVQSLNDGDQLYIPFVLARYFACEGGYVGHRFMGRIYLSSILSDPLMREKIRAKFHYGLSELRKDLIARPIYIFDTAYGNAKNYSLRHISYLFFRKLWFSLILRDYRRKRREKQKLTL